MKRRTFLEYSGKGVAASLVLPLSNKLYADETLYPEDIKPKSAKYIWINKDGEGRNLYANFRKSFNIKSIPSSALFQLFADTSYQLFVNDIFVNQGPVRFDPRYPVFDQIDLVPYLVKGNNTIAVQVNYFGCKTYKSIANRAGFVCWGNIISGKDTITLVSNKSWKALEASERSSNYVGKMSFALNPSDYFHQSKEQHHWKKPTYSDKNWPQAVELTLQNSWGTLAIRKIPLFPHDEIPITKVLKILPLEKKEDVYSFMVPIPKYYEDGENYKGMYIAYYTWVYSETDQTIPVSSFWGENWINEQSVAKGIPLNSLKIECQWPLKKGWNYMFGKVGPYSDILFQYFGFPKNIDIKVSADKDPNTGVIFRRMPVQDSVSFKKYYSSKALPFSNEDKLSDSGGWVEVKSDEKASSPAFETSWDYYKDEIESVKSESLNGFVFKKEFYPDGFYILMDMEFMHLSLPFLKVEGIKGATIDVSYSEYIQEDQKHLNISFLYKSADRIVCDKDILEWIPSHPRGVRYLGLTIRNNKSDVRLSKISLLPALYPIKEIGSFKCSDPLLNEIWDICRRTQRANMEDVYVDCSGRERGMYVRDVYIQYHNNLATFGDHALMKRCLELYAQSPDEVDGKIRAVYPNVGHYTISDFCLNAVEGYKAYYENTGDKDFILKCWPVLVKNLKWFEELSDEREDRLLDAEWPTNRKVDSMYGGFHGDLADAKGYNDNHGINCQFTAEYIAALQCAQFLAKELGKKEDEENYSKRINFLGKSLEAFWDPKVGLYSDNLSKKTYSPHASLLAIRTGLVPSARLSIIKKELSKSLQYIFINGYGPESGSYISPAFTFYLFDGLYKAGLDTVAERLMKNGWGWVLSTGLKTCPEYFVKDSIQSECHAWSASPVFYLSKNILGIHYPNAPNVSLVEIKIQPGSVTSAEGSYPHPFGGTIDVKWHKEGESIVMDYVKAPKGVEIKILN